MYAPACGRLIAPDFESDPDNCGGCNVVCDAMGAASACVEGACVVDACQPGFIDIDGDPSNGCECRGETPDACTLCLAYDRPGDQRDDDCDGRVDEDAAAQWSDVIPLSRAHCGAVGASCLLDVGAEAVECALSWCNALDYAQGECGHGDGTTICAPVGDPDDVDRYDCGTCVQIYPERGKPRVSFETLEQCFDALDNDGSGVADDGPECEVLLANARTTACSGAAPSEECPAYHLEIPTNEPRLPTVEVAFTYDVLIDRHEVTRQQYAAHLTAQDRCDTALPIVDPGCHFDRRDALLPAVAVGWREALDYCIARGKRLPTYAEFARAALADYAAPGDPHDTQSRPADAVCDAMPAPVIAICGADGAVDATRRDGDAYVGSRHRPEAWLSAKAIRHLTGNVSEWMLDYYVDWCEAARAGHPKLSVLVCPAESEPGWAHQRGPLVDLAFEQMMYDISLNDDHFLMGGAFAGPADAWRLEHRERASGSGRPYSGFRCARTLTSSENPDPLQDATEQ